MAISDDAWADYANDLVERGSERIFALEDENTRLRTLIGRVFADRHEPDKVAAYCMEALPHLAHTATKGGHRG